MLSRYLSREVEMLYILSVGVSLRYVTEKKGMHVSYGPYLYKGSVVITQKIDLNE